MNFKIALAYAIVVTCLLGAAHQLATDGNIVLGFGLLGGGLLGMAKAEQLVSRRHREIDAAIRRHPAGKQIR